MSLFWVILQKFYHPFKWLTFQSMKDAKHLSLPSGYAVSASQVALNLQQDNKHPLTMKISCLTWRMNNNIHELGRFCLNPNEGNQIFILSLQHLLWFVTLGSPCFPRSKHGNETFPVSRSLCAISKPMTLTCRSLGLWFGWFFFDDFVQES